MLEVRDLETSYGRSQVLFKINLQVREGEVVTLLGRNGMGKTTTVRSIMGITPAKAGSISYGGKEIHHLPSYRVAQAGIGLDQRKDVLAAELAHGEQRQLEIAMALATRPRLLLLDEPVAGMGTDESARMVKFLETLKGTKTIVLVEHDMDAVFTLADRISVLVYGRIVATGTPAEIRANPEVRAAYLGEDH